ncbi:uncharacterized protein LOC134338713 [Mobula hypostoma]|uniref:uncharacterized protein LOC134338713 n=1 Tax=Mobula hypostoma TaxID=723540 RepID=UPI002FC31771
MSNAAFFLVAVVMKIQMTDTQGLGKLRLSADRVDNFYFAEESVTFTCESNYQYSFCEFELVLEQRPLQTKPQTTISVINTVLFTTKVLHTSSRYYTCVYKSKLSQKPIAQSEAVLITVIGQKNLRLSADRADKVYLKGESVNFTCESNEAHKRSHFQLSGVRQYSPEGDQADTSKTKKVTFAFMPVNTGKQFYYCLAPLGQSSAEAIEILATHEVRLSADREDKVYFKGESVKFTCDSYSERAVQTFELYEGGQFVSMPRKTASSWIKTATFYISALKTGISYYQCRAGSASSRKLKITILAGLDKLRLSADRADRVYLREELIVLTCEAKNRRWLNNFHLYDGGRHLAATQEEIASRSNAVNFTVVEPESGPHHYVCLYTSSTYSEQSDIVNITVVDLPIPLLSVVSPDVVQGGNVIFICRSPQEFPRITFYLYEQNGLNNLVSSNPNPQNNAVNFTIQNIDRNRSGDYSCVYEAVVEGRRFTSAWSNSVHLSVRGKFFWEWILIPAVILLVVCAIVGIYCWKNGKIRGRSGKKTESAAEDHVYASITPDDRDHGNQRAALSPSKDRSDGNVVYADITMELQTKERNNHQDNFEIHNDDGTVYAAVKQ